MYVLTEYPLQSLLKRSEAMLVSSIAEEIPRLIKLELVLEPSIKAARDVRTARVGVIAIATLGPCWMDPIINFLAEDRIPDNEKEANKIRRVASRYWLSNEWKVYHRSFGGPYLLCLHLEKVSQLLAELHEGVYDSHVGGRSLAHWAMT